jgi:glucose-1-phosphate cytidylyltransferase
VRPPARFGVLESENGLVKNFGEKRQSDAGWINGGYFVLHRKVLDLIQDDSTVFEAEPLHILAEKGELAVYQHEGFWQCMDTYRELELLNDLHHKNQAPWQVWR